MNNSTRKTVHTLLLLALLGINLAHASEELRVKAQSWFPNDHVITQYLYTDWKQNVESGDNTRLKVELSPAEFQPEMALNAIRDGRVDVSYHTAAYTPQKLPLSASLAEYGPLFNNPLALILAATEMNLTDPQMQQQWRDAGIVYGGSFATPPYYLVCNKPIRGISDFKGLRVRIPSRPVREWAQSLGALPTLVDANAQEQALANGSLDCTSTMLGNLKDRQLWNTAKHVLLLPLSTHWAGFAWGYNPDFWRALPIDERQNLFIAQAKSQHRFIKALYVTDQAARAGFVEHEVQSYKPTIELKDHFTRFKAQHKKRLHLIARENFSVKGSLAYLDRFENLYQDWVKRVGEKHCLSNSDLDVIAIEQVYGKLDIGNYGRSQ